MDSFLKRTHKNIDDSHSVAKKRKTEEDTVKERKIETCPHAERCYRRNPHHFKEYDHPHLIQFMEMADIVIPDGMPQPKNIYLEQIEILKPLLKNKRTDEKSSQRPEAGTSLSVGKQVTNNKISSDTSKKSQKIIETVDLTHSPSSSNGNRTSNSGKFTTYQSQQDMGIRPKAAPGTMLEKIERAAPYNIFFTTIIKSAETLKQPNAITFTDLLCPSLGELKCSLQINFMIDIDWLLKQYKARGLSRRPLTIIFGDDWPDMAKFIDMFCPNISYKLVKMKDPFGVHHSKIGIYVYEDLSLRVVISTANLYYEDWNHYNQGLWLSPLCPRLPDASADSDGESPTGFKDNFLNYLKSYGLTHLKPFIEYVKRADFSAVKVFFVYSVPGKHFPTDNGSHLHRVGDLLSRHCSLPVKTTPKDDGPLSWEIIAQSSSIGSMGKSPAAWLRGSLLRALASHKKAKMAMSSAVLNIVYPSVDNVMTGYFGPESGGCLPYSKATNEKQKWLQEYMHQWKAESYGRTRAMPHIKTYCRVSPCKSKLAYFLLTSANLSKSAWGGPITKENSVYVRSYEAGVMFLPSFFDEEYFEIAQGKRVNKNTKLFPFMFDLPLTPYRPKDYPWCN